jgi:predicted site-specific integrase-resolvase
MPLTIDGRTYYRTNEVCQMAGISRSTLFRWLKQGLIDVPAARDWRGWRLFDASQVKQIKERTGLIISTGQDNLF